MQPAAIGLFAGLAAAGAVLGFFTGRHYLGAEYGLYVAPATALIGLLLAWMLWVSRPRRDGREYPPPASGPDAPRLPGKGQPRGGPDTVNRSARSGKQGRKRR